MEYACLWRFTMTTLSQKAGAEATAKTTLWRVAPIATSEKATEF
jgi:hypothetical protein